MDFRSVNPLNVHVNLFSGNLLPLASGDSRFHISLKIYSALMWLIQVAQVIVMIVGVRAVSWEKSLRDGTVTMAVGVEVFFAATRIYFHRNLVDQLIQKFNDILHAADDTMRNLVTTTLKPMETPLKFYWIGGSLSVFMWCCVPLLLVLEKATFVYEDYRMPAAFSNQPFSIGVFLIGSVFIIIGNLYVFLKKVGVDVYIIHLVLLTTVQYRYMAVRLATIFREGNAKNELDGFRRRDGPDVNQQVKKDIRALCRHHLEVTYLSSILKRLLSVNFSLIYLNSVLRFCFIGVMMSAVASITILEAISIFMYACGSTVQFYLLCSCVQQLLDASKELTNEAFHEPWYQFGPSVKRTFISMILSNNMECKISSCDKYNLSLPSFMAILNQSYSITLVLLRMN